MAKAAIRTCIVCRKASDKSELLRIVRAADGELLLDKDFKLEGRGAYVHARAVCLVKLAQPKLWEHAFRKQSVKKESIGSLMNILKTLTD